MNEASANPAALAPIVPPPPVENWAAGPVPDEGWSRKKMLFLIALAVIAHVALIVVFGTKKPFVPKAVTNVPQLQFMTRADELVELANPALFALPNPRDFSAAIWQQAPGLPSPSFRWAARPGELAAPAPDTLGTAFTRFMATNRFGNFRLDFKPPPQFATPVSSLDSSLPQQTTLQISLPLATRLLAQPALPSLELNDILPPSRVQVLVDQTGNVISAALLPVENSREAAGRSLQGDTNAVALALRLKFAPAAQLAAGAVTFYWHTVPLASTNAPAIPEPKP